MNLTMKLISLNHNLLLKDSAREKQVDKSVQKEELKEEESIRCKNCEHKITSPKMAIEPHEHTFRNPAGFSFHIVCFSDAPGAEDVGAPTTVATWFPGYAWSFARCQQCQIHLGWWYVGKDQFVGLIAQRLLR